MNNEYVRLFAYAERFLSKVMSYGARRGSVDSLLQLITDERRQRVILR